MILEKINKISKTLVRLGNKTKSNYKLPVSGIKCYILIEFADI